MLSILAYTWNIQLVLIIHRFYICLLTRICNSKVNTCGAFEGTCGFVQSGKTHEAPTPTFPAEVKHSLLAALIGQTVLFSQFTQCHSFVFLCFFVGDFSI